MRTVARILLSLTLRFVLLLAFSLAGMAALAEFGPSFLQANSVLAAEKKPATTGVTAASYQWNLNVEGTPLLSLPDRVGRDLDLSLTYSIGRFELPLFQSLYYNERAGKYILMLMDKPSASTSGATRRAEFVDFARLSDGRKSQATQNVGLQLADTGNVKLLTSPDGTTYTFAALPDGELHCRQIRDRFGSTISLSYQNDGAIQTISDNSGRTIIFNYANENVSSITQTWDIDAKQVKQTWVVAEEVHFAHRPASTVLAVSPLTSKHIPSNALKSTYTEKMAASDLVLAKIFGGPGAIAAGNGFEPGNLGSQYPLYRGDIMSDDGRVLRGHLSFAMHLYGSADGTGESNIYIPSGFVSHSAEPTPTDAVVTFYYPRLGNLTNVTLAVFHIKNFQLSYEGERVNIGNIGGRGGSYSYYKHSHIEFFHGNVGLPTLRAREVLRIDPATVFGN
ncbi:MAG TPA: hypothetical protein VLL54_20255 [Pyrinomonadaceae bacterium]|nr:hypothetical protein [Pyrinomonadaceae bacterium]